MAMHHSSELAETAMLLFEQLTQLGASLWICGFCICKKDSQRVEKWVSPPDGKMMDPVYVPYTIDEFEQCAYETWISGREIYSDIMEGIKLQESHEQLLEHPSMQKAKNYLIENNISMPTWVQRYAVSYTHGYLMFVILKPFEETQIFIRIARVFEQTYTRFLDLQKAEAQAREAQIELGLERVRARAMAMQHSDELADVATVLFQQVSDLGIQTWTTGFNIWSDDNNAYEDWITDPAGGFIEPYTVDATAFSEFKKLSDAKKSGTDFFVLHQEGETLKETYEHLRRFANQNQFGKLLESGFTFPLSQYIHLVFGAKVSLMFITYAPLPEAHNIFKRFGKVFEQTYVRFLDLQKAEAQAREAKIEAALERVRARTMAMQKSDELDETNMLIMRQLESLDMSLSGTGIHICYSDKPVSEAWMWDMHGRQDAEGNV
jgi:hypothetical protein